MNQDTDRNMGKPFELLEFPLDSGFRVIEAGAGSGKTHNLVRLVLRLNVGEGFHRTVLAMRILMVNFIEEVALQMRQRLSE